MKNEDRVVGLLSELVHKQDVFTDKLTELVHKQDVFTDKLTELVHKQDVFTDKLSEMVHRQDAMVDELKEQKRTQIRQENLLIQILEVLQDDVPRFDELIEMEQLDGGKRIVLRKYRSSSMNNDQLSMINSQVDN